MKSEALKKSSLALSWIRNSSFGQWRLITSFFCIRRESVEESRNYLEFFVTVSLAWMFLCSVEKFRGLIIIINAFGLDLQTL